MQRKLLLILSFISLFSAVFGQDENDTIDLKLDKGPEPLEFVFRPQVSLGTGMFTFYGDIGSNHKFYHPTVSRIGYDLRVINPITDYIDMGFYVLFGQVSGSERTLTRNLNFNSNISTGGLTFNYNFKQLLNPKRKVDPYISVGIESVEFLSKTDLYDADGNMYNYWSDGTIRDMAEGAVGAENAKEIYRDYVYESDVREQNLDGFGHYSEKTWAIPVEAGMNMHLGKKVKFRIGTSMHFTFSDLVDGVTDQSVGDRVGNKGKDKFLYTHFALTYNLDWRRSKAGDDGYTPFDGDWNELDSTDSDGDMVVDFADLCAKTPIEGRPVDEKGCPLDYDNDGVPDYMDDELSTEEGALVDDRGVTLGEEDFFLQYRMYKDSIGEFATMLDCLRVTYAEGGVPRHINTEGTVAPEYIIPINTVNGELSHESSHALLDEAEFRVVKSGDGSPEYIVGPFKTLEEATREMDRLKKNGVDVGGIAAVTKKGNEESITMLSDDDIAKARGAGGDIPEARTGAMYRVQIGAFKKELSSSVFGDADNVVFTKGKDGLYRYYSGSFDDKNSAAKHRIKMLTKGYEGAFIVAFKDGERVKLGDSGFEVNEGHEDVIVESDRPTGSVVRKELIKFKVQVGAYANDIPTEVLDLYLSIGNVKPKRDKESGLTKYLIGEFEDYEEAEEFKRELEREGLIDSFVIGDFNGKIITAQEALELLNE